MWINYIVRPYAVKMLEANCIDTQLSSTNCLKTDMVYEFSTLVLVTFFQENDVL